MSRCPGGTRATLGNFNKKPAEQSHSIGDASILVACARCRVSDTSGAERLIESAASQAVALHARP